MKHKNFPHSNSTLCGTKRLKFLATLFFGFMFVIHSNAQINAYGFNQSVQPYIPIAGGTVLGVATAASGTVTSLDDIIYFLPPGTIPFPFNFNGTLFDGLYVSTNGFITFGTTAPTQTFYNPISNAALYDGAISAVGRDLNGLFNIDGNTGEVRYQTIYLPPPDESTPIEFVIQWSNVRPFNTSTSTTDYFRWNFQIRLQTNGSIKFVYDFSATGVPNPVTNIQVGLRGANNSFVPNVNNRSIVNGVQTWSTSVPGSLSNSDCDANASLLPVPGQTYTYTPPPPPPCPEPAGLAATSVTSTSAVLNWSCAGCSGIFRLEYNTSPATFEGIGNVVFEPANSPIPISGLLHGTSYTFFVRQDCDINGFSTVSSSSFTTAFPGESCTDNPLGIAVYPDLPSAMNTLLTTGTTQDGPDGDCSNATGNVAKKDRWTQFVAPSNGNKIVITTSSGTITNALMQIWSDCPGTGTAIACNDDATPGNFMPEISLCQSQYIAGQIYYVRIWPFSPIATGNYNLKIYETSSCLPPPVNDDCVNGTVLPVTIYPNCPAAEISGTTVNATTSIGLANTICDQFGTYNDVFYTFYSGANTSVVLNFNVLSGTSEVAVYSSCTGSIVGCFSSGTNTITGLTLNTTYIIRVWSNPFAEGTFAICLSEPDLSPTVSAGGDQTIVAGQTAQLNGSFGGGATVISWSTSGSGTFTPSSFDVSATYVPSAADITTGSVTLTITTDAPPGYSAAVDQMTITILPYPLSTAIQSVKRINYLAPYEMLLSPHIAINFSYNNQVNPTWYLNLMGYDYNTSTEFWLAQNISLDSFPGSRDLVYEANLADRINLHAGDPLSQLGIKIFVNDSVWHNMISSPVPAYQVFTIQSIDYWNGVNFIGTESTDTISPVPPRPPNTYTEADTSRSVVRGCTMPNIDLDGENHPAGNYPPSNTFYAGDPGGCGPASASNSMQWLEARHPSEINSGLSHREKMEQLSALMDRNTNEGVTEEDFIKGKLAFIDANKLPIHVKYQSNLNTDAAITSPHAPTYGHSAQNQGNDLGDGEKNHLDFDWLFEEMKNGEDVEMWLSTKRITYGDLFGSLVIAEIKTISSSLVVLTGISEVDGVKSLDYKNDTDEGDSGGTRERVGAKIDTLPGGFPFIDSFDDPLSDPEHPVKIVTAIDGFYSESYDPLMTFPPIVFAGSDFSIVSGGTAPMNGSFSGSATSIAWSSSGSGEFFPSASITSAEYIPSAADIISGSVVLTITSDSVPGYQKAQDQMTLTILPPPANTVIYSVQRINELYPEIIPLSTQFAVNYNYLSIDTFIWHMNIMGYDYRTNTEFWLARNLSLHPFAGTRDLVFEPDMSHLINLQQGDTMSSIGIKLFVTDTVWFDPYSSPSFAYQSFSIQPVDYLISNNTEIAAVAHPGVPHIYVPPNTYVRTDTSRSVIRGCTMPNIDLDSSQHNPTTTPGYAGDKNACGPASTANSMGWLELRHPGKINSGLASRAKLEEFSELMNRQPNGVSVENFIKGKLAFIDKHKLPIHVKYQTSDNLISAATIASPHVPSYDHKAENKGANAGQNKNNIDFNWIFDEMKKGEDVEIFTETFKFTAANPTTPIPAGGHFAMISGIEEKKGVRTIEYKDDYDQAKNSGLREVTGVKFDTIPGGYPFILDKTEKNGDRYVTYIYGAISESFDSTITFEPKVSAGPDKAIPAGSKAKMAGGVGGSATSIAWSSSGTGVFTPSDTDTIAEYIPSAVDIISGSVILTIKSDSVPGYAVAEDQMTLTILPPPANTVIYSVQRINHVYPYDIPLSQEFAINFNYLSTDTFTWHFNIMGYDYRNNTQFWIARNLSLEPFPGTRDLVYEFNLGNLTSLNAGDTLNDLGIKMFVSDTIWYDPVMSPSVAYQTYSIQPVDNLISNGVDISTTVTHPVPHIYVPPNPFVRTDTSKSVLRGCTMSNIDLDSSQHNPVTTPGYAGDKNACAPAAVANSMGWLEQRHPDKINSGLTNREKLEEISGLMNRPVEGFATAQNIVKAKLAFIDKHKLPVHVKYQAQTGNISAASIASPHEPSYGHSAENKSPNIGQDKNNIDFNWIFEEMKKGEDVEIAWSTYKQVFDTADGTFFWVQAGGHTVLLTGIEEKKGVRTFDYKDDRNQKNSTGTREVVGARFDTIPGGYPASPWSQDKAGNWYRSFIDAVFSESLDTTVKFEPKVSAGPDKSIPAGGNAKMEGKYGGSASGIVWSTSGSGIFLPSVADTVAEYTPSATDIISGTVILTIRSDSVPGYEVAEDQMTLTILPYPPTVTLQLKVLIEGLYRGSGLMQSILYDHGLSSDSTATDSITINLWAPADLNVPAYSQKVIVHQDGTATVIFPQDVLGNSYYIAIRSRNAIETWSKDPVLFNNQIVSFDFTSQ